MTVTEHDQQNTGQQAAPVASTWSERLSAPFPAEVIAYRPQPWCKACNDAADKVCGRHHKVKCPRCGQTMTDAHFDAEYVGHADVTMRLNDVDPRWRWEPAYHDVDPGLLAKAIESGNQQIVQMLIQNSPPLLDRANGMWMYLIVHDDNGQEVPILCYGDAGSKSGPNAVKERYGDGIRNGAMRRGVATELWSKSERETATGEAGDGTRQIKPAGGKQDSSPGAAQAPPAAEPEPAAGVAVATALAKLAYTLAQKDDTTVADLEAKVLQQAVRRQQLNVVVPDPFSEGQTAALSVVIRHAKAVVEQRPAAA